MSGPSINLQKLFVDTIPIRNWNLQRPPKLLSVRQSRYHTYKELKLQPSKSIYASSLRRYHTYKELKLFIDNNFWTSCRRYHTYKELKHLCYCFVHSFNKGRYHTYKELKHVFQNEHIRQNPLFVDTIPIRNWNLLIRKLLIVAYCVDTIPIRNWNCRVKIFNCDGVPSRYHTYKELKL